MVERVVSKQHGVCADHDYCSVLYEMAVHHRQLLMVDHICMDNVMFMYFVGICAVARILTYGFVHGWRVHEVKSRLDELMTAFASAVYIHACLDVCVGFQLLSSSSWYGVVC